MSDKQSKDDGTSGYYRPTREHRHIRDYWAYMAGLREPYQQRSGAIAWRFGVQLIIAAVVIAIPIVGLAALIWCIWCLVRGIRLMATQRRRGRAREGIGPARVVVHAPSQPTVPAPAGLHPWELS